MKTKHIHQNIFVGTFFTILLTITLIACGGDGGGGTEDDDAEITAENPATDPNETPDLDPGTSAPEDEVEGGEIIAAEAEDGEEEPIEATATVDGASTYSEIEIEQDHFTLNFIIIPASDGGDDGHDDENDAGTDHHRHTASRPTHLGSEPAREAHVDTATSTESMGARAAFAFVQKFDHATLATMIAEAVDFDDTRPIRKPNRVQIHGPCQHGVDHWTRIPFRVPVWDTKNSNLYVTVTMTVIFRTPTDHTDGNCFCGHDTADNTISQPRAMPIAYTYNSSASANHRIQRPAQMHEEYLAGEIDGRPSSNHHQGPQAAHDDGLLTQGTADSDARR